VSVIWLPDHLHDHRDGAGAVARINPGVTVHLEQGYLTDEVQGRRFELDPAQVAVLHRLLADDDAGGAALGDGDGGVLCLRELLSYGVVRVDLPRRVRVAGWWQAVHAGDDQGLRTMRLLREVRVLVQGWSLMSVAAACVLAVARRCRLPLLVATATAAALALPVTGTGVPLRVALALAALPALVVASVGLHEAGHLYVLRRLMRDRRCGALQFGRWKASIIRPPLDASRLLLVALAGPLFAGGTGLAGMIAFLHNPVLGPALMVLTSWHLAGLAPLSTDGRQILRGLLGHGETHTRALDVAVEDLVGDGFQGEAGGALREGGEGGLGAGDLGFGGAAGLGEGRRGAEQGEGFLDGAFGGGAGRGGGGVEEAGEAVGVGAASAQQVEDGEGMEAGAQVGAGLLAGDAGLGSDVEEVVTELEGDADSFAILGQGLDDPGRRAGELGAEAAGGGDQGAGLVGEDAEVVLDRVLAVEGAADVADLALDQPGDRVREDPGRLGAEVGGELGGAGEQVVAGEDGDLVVIAGVGRAGAAPDLGLVHDVVVVEGRQVSQLDCGRCAGHLGLARVAEMGAEQHQGRPEALATGTDEVAGGLLDERVGGGDGVAQGRLDPLQTLADTRLDPSELLSDLSKRPRHP